MAKRRLVLIREVRDLFLCERVSLSVPAGTVVVVIIEFEPQQCKQTPRPEISVANNMC